MFESHHNRIPIRRLLLLLGTLMILAVVPMRGWDAASAGSMNASPSVAGATIALTRLINQPAGTATPAIAMRMLGQPFKTGEVPAGDIVSATLGGAAVRTAECDQGGPLHHVDGSVRWARLLVDYSGQKIPAGGNATLQLTAVPGTWSSSSKRSDADWQNLHDIVVMSNLSATFPGGGANNGYSGAGYTLPSGNWVAKFDKTATVTHICATPLGNVVVVKAPLINGSTINAQAVATMEYWVSQLANGSLGPIFSRGPFIENMYLYKNNPATGAATPTSFVASFAWTRNGSCPRSYGGCSWNNIGVWSLTSALMMRPDADWDCWYSSGSSIFGQFAGGGSGPCTAAGGSRPADNTAAWVWEDYKLVRATRTIPPFADGINAYYNPLATDGTQPSSPLTYPVATVTGYNSSTGVFSVNDALALTANSGGAPYPPGQAIEFNNTGGMKGIAAQTVYWVCALTNDNVRIYNSQINSLQCGSTGQIIPGGTPPSGMTMQLDIAPESYGRIYWGMSEGSSRPDLAVIPEWGAAYLVAPLTSTTSPWTAQIARRFGRVNAWLDWSIPQHVLNDQTGCIPSLLDAATTAGFTGPCVSGAQGLGVAQPYLIWANLGSWPITVNNGEGPVGGFGIWGASPGGTCWVYNGCGDVNRQHYPGNAPFILWLLEGDPYMQQQIMTVGNRGLSDISVGNRVATIGSQTWSGNILEFLCVRCGAWSWRDVTMAAYAAPEGSAEQQYYRAIIANNVAIVNAYMNSKPASYKALFMLNQNDDDFGTQPNGGLPADTFQYSYETSAQMLGAALNGEFIPGLNQMAQNSVTVPLYLAAVGVGGATGATPCTYWVDAWAFSVSRTDIGATGPGDYISNLNQIAVPLSTYPLAIFTAGSAVIQQDPRGAGYAPMNGDQVRFSNLDAAVEAIRDPAPSPFVDGSNGQGGDYAVINTPPPGNAGGSFQLAVSSGGPALVASASSSARETGFWFIPGPNQSCPATGGSKTGVGQASFSESYLMYQTAAAGYMAAYNNTFGGLGNAFGLTNAAETAYQNLTARLTGGGLPAQCKTADYCIGDHW